MNNDNTDSIYSMCEFYNLSMILVKIISLSKLVFAYSYLIDNAVRFVKLSSLVVDQRIFY